VTRFSSKLEELKGRIERLPDSDQTSAGLDTRSPEESFELVFRSHPSVQLLVDPGTERYLDVNEAACAFYGYSHEHFLNLDLTDVNSLDTKSIRREMAMAMAREQRVFNFRHKTASGVVKDVEVYTQPLTLFGRDLLLETVVDISELAKAWRIQALLLEISEAASVTDDLYHLIYMIRDRLHDFLDTTNFIVALYDSGSSEYSFPFVADSKLNEIAPGPRPGSLIDYVRRTGRPLLVDSHMFDALVKRGELDKSKHEAKCWLGVPLQTGSGVIGVVAVQHYNDVNAFKESDLELMEFISGSIAVSIERRRAEEALRESERRFRRFFQRSPDGLYSLDIPEAVSLDLP
jgi:PAS domain S-box-containing protein